MAKHRYGRGTFEVHPDHLKYMEMIVDSPRYAGLPGARDGNGRIQWQVSSGKTTAFYVYYERRKQWWAQKADDLGLPGKGNENERFSVTARLIHPTGERPCRLCGRPWRVGYYYLNDRASKHLNARARKSGRYQKLEAIDEVISKLQQDLGDRPAFELLLRMFPERKDALLEHGLSGATFRTTQHLRTHWLSPGYMCNPPDRLEGFHDYCLECRPEKDPGRSEANLRSYIHDRRAFEWWAEGDWNVADALYNTAGPGRCAIKGELVDKVSPDHIGPLACGFKHIPLFQPTCPACNSAKNRRMRHKDVQTLIEYERRTGDSPAGWQVRPLWDHHKYEVSSDRGAATLSTTLREVQDFYLRALHALLEIGRAGMLSGLLNPQFACFDVEFTGLDPGSLTFTSCTKTQNNSNLKQSLAARSVRIAFEELRNYVAKGLDKRKIGAKLARGMEIELQALVEFAHSLPLTPWDKAWTSAVDQSLSAESQERMIARLITSPTKPSEADSQLRRRLEALFASAARSLKLELDSAEGLN